MNKRQRKKQLKKQVDRITDTLSGALRQYVGGRIRLPLPPLKPPRAVRFLSIVDDLVHVAYEVQGYRVNLAFLNPLEPLEGQVWESETTYAWKIGCRPEPHLEVAIDTDLPITDAPLTCLACLGSRAP